MKQYQISFYSTQCPFSGAVAVYYREFDSVKELKEWAKYWINEGTFYTSFKYIKISKAVYLENV